MPSTTTGAEDPAICTDISAVFSQVFQQGTKAVPAENHHPLLKVPNQPIALANPFDVLPPSSHAANPLFPFPTGVPQTHGNSLSGPFGTSPVFQGFSNSTDFNGQYTIPPWITNHGLLTTTPNFPIDPPGSQLFAQSAPVAPTQQPFDFASHQGAEILSNQESSSRTASRSCSVQSGSSTEVEFASSSSSTATQRTTSLTKPASRDYRCKVCTKSFKNSATLRSHIMTHTGERPFHCMICTKSYSTKNRLTIHMRDHTNEKPYVCAECGYASKQMCGLRTHMATHMSADEKLAWKEKNQRTLPCDVCGKKYKNAASLEQHVLKVHSA
ncbi:hypothetical protein HDU98_009178 [Podochytrium sp. JEL0797]|nr:hypothetical protein HDU98_009178 [Podochytrium sp. JEL0797]